MAARSAMQVLSAYNGAAKTRLRSNWSPASGSADADLLPDLPTLRDRSRDLNRNDAHAAAITSTIVENVIGTGIRPQCMLDEKALGLTPAEAKEFRRQAERAWWRWHKTADAQNRMDFDEIQKLIQRQILENGEVLLLPLMIKDEPWRPYQLALEVIEADRLETPLDKLGDPTIRDGVVIGSRGQPIGYWIRTKHPGDVTGFITKETVTPTYRYYPARNKAGRPNVIHLYHVKRPGQTRGEPFFAPVMGYFKDLSDVLEAKLVTERVAACFSAFITKNDPYQGMQGAVSSLNSKNQPIQEFEPGMIAYLGAGEDIKIASPNNPGGNFSPFVDTVLRGIGAALGLPLELVLKDFSKTNYSSARAALLEARRFFRGYQQWFAARVCQPVWEMVTEEAWLREDLPPVNLFTDQRDEYLAARWIYPGWGWVDPVKEVESSTMAINATLSTLAEECASQGRDWEEVMEQQKREQDKRKELGMDPVVPIAGKPGQPPPEEEEPEQEKEPVPEEEPANA